MTSTRQRFRPTSKDYLLSFIIEDRLCYKQKYCMTSILIKQEVILDTNSYCICKASFWDNPTFG